MRSTCFGLPLYIQWLPSSFATIRGCLVIILAAWFRRIVGYAISNSIDARLTLAALRTVIARSSPPPGGIHHSYRGSQYAA